MAEFVFFLKKRERKKRNPQSCKLFLVAIWWLINSRKNYNKSRTNKKQPKAIIFCGTKTAPWRRKTNNAHQALMTSTRKGARWISFEMLSNAETKIRRTGKKCLILFRKILKKQGLGEAVLPDVIPNAKKKTTYLQLPFWVNPSINRPCHGFWRHLDE